MGVTTRKLTYGRATGATLAMPEELLTQPLFILVIGSAMVLAMLVKAGLVRQLRFIKHGLAGG